MKTIPYSKPCFTCNEFDLINDALISGWVTRGPKIREFEKIVSKYCGAKYAVAVSSGTAALHLSAIVSGLKTGKCCWTTPITFAATANAILHTGSDINFVDIESDTINIDVNLLEKKLIKAEAEDKLPDVVIPVHFAGQSCQMDYLYELSKKYRFKIIEDACHALGGEYRGDKIGSCQFSDVFMP